MLVRARVARAVRHEQLEFSKSRKPLCCFEMIDSAYLCRWRVVHHHIESSNRRVNVFLEQNRTKIAVPCVTHIITAPLTNRPRGFHLWGMLTSLSKDDDDDDDVGICLTYTRPQPPLVCVSCSFVLAETSRPVFRRFVRHEKLRKRGPGLWIQEATDAFHGKRAEERRRYSTHRPPKHVSHGIARLYFPQQQTRAHVAVQIRGQNTTQESLLLRAACRAGHSERPTQKGRARLEGFFYRTAVANYWAS